MSSSITPNPWCQYLSICFAGGGLKISKKRNAKNPKITPIKFCVSGGRHINTNNIAEISSQTIALWSALPKCFPALSQK